MYGRKMRGMYISKRALRNHFDPRKYPCETYLLCELQWRGSHKFWQHWVRNDNSNDYHVERLFLEEIFEPRSYNICDMTWYLSYSPCGECCCAIQDFLEEEPNVNIDIRVARLYKVHEERNRLGLMELANSPRVTIDVMEAEDYIYCWETFIQPGVNYHFSPENFESAIDRNCAKLESILQNRRITEYLKLKGTQKIIKSFSSHDYLKLNNVTKVIIHVINSYVVVGFHYNLFGLIIKL